MLVVLAAAVLLTVVPLGLGLCRVAARSEEAEALALVRWHAARAIIGPRPQAPEQRSDPVPFERQRGTRRAAG